MSEGFDFLSRLNSFLDTFGVGGLMVVLCFVVIVIGITFIRGLGLLLFTLFVSYSLGAVTTGGIIFLSTLVRWGCLILLGVGFFKYYHAPKPSMLLMMLYAMLGLVFVFFAPEPMFSMQQSLLLLATIICTSVAISSYIVSLDKLEHLFKMGIAAASVWTVCNLFLARGFMYSEYMRFSTDEAVSAVQAVYSGAFFTPMVVWGIVQKKSKIMRIYCVCLIIPFVFIMLLTGVRSALFGMVGIALLPLILLKTRPFKIILSIILIGIVAAGSIFAMYTFLPEKAGPLIERVFSSETTGRTERWAIGLRWCIEEAVVFGKGIGSSDIMARREFGISFHNSYLEIWGNTGILGLLTVLLFLFVYIKKGIHLTRQSTGKETAVYSRILLGYILAITAMGLVESLFAAAGSVGIFMLIMAAAMVDRLSQLVEDENRFGHTSMGYEYLEQEYPDYHNEYGPYQETDETYLPNRSSH